MKRRPLMRIGQEFELPPGNIWRVTDVGQRTFLVVDVTGTLVTHDGDKSWLNGPPYAVVEHVFDETDFGALEGLEGIVWERAKVPTADCPRCHGTGFHGPWGDSDHDDDTPRRCNHCDFDEAKR